MVCYFSLCVSTAAADGHASLKHAVLVVAGACLRAPVSIRAFGVVWGLVLCLVFLLVGDKKPGSLADLLLLVVATASTQYA